MLAWLSALKPLRLHKCACACISVCVHACMCVFTHACVCASVSVWVRSGEGGCVISFLYSTCEWKCVVCTQSGGECIHTFIPAYVSLSRAWPYWWQLSQFAGWRVFPMSPCETADVSMCPVSVKWLGVAHTLTVVHVSVESVIRFDVLERSSKSVLVILIPLAMPDKPPISSRTKHVSGRVSFRFLLSRGVRHWFKFKKKSIYFLCLSLC